MPTTILEKKNGKAPFIVALSMIKNEEDIIEPFIRHNLEYIDLICVLDNNSFDQTRKILESLQQEGLPIIILDDPNKTYNQEEKMTKLCHQAMLTIFPDYIFFLDADEFIKCKSKHDFLNELKKIPINGKAYIPWQSYIADKSCNESHDFKMENRLKNESNPIFKIVLHTANNYNSNIIVNQGNHDVLGIGNSIILDHVKLAHYPIRNIKQIKEKCISGWMAYLLKSPKARNKGLGFHWLEIFDKIKDDTLNEESAIEFSANYSKITKENWENNIINDPMNFNFSQLKYTGKSNTSSLSKIARLIEENLEFKEDPFHQYFNEILEKKEIESQIDESDFSRNDQIFFDNWHFENLFLDIPPFKYFALSHKPQSVLDVGCGIGQYLTFFKYSGAKKVLGIDGISQSSTLLDKDEFISQDLENRIEIDQKFDLVICLETLEHLNHDTSIRVLNDVSKHANNQIIFSAAEPGQPGIGHINCMPIGFWIEKWESLGWEVNEFETISMRMLSTFSWFKRNLLVLNKVNKNGTFKHSIIDHISFREYIWWDQKPAIVLSTLQENLCVPWNQTNSASYHNPSLMQINELLEIELKKTIEEVEKQKKDREHLNLNNINLQKPISAQLFYKTATTNYNESDSLRLNVNKRLSKLVFNFRESVEVIGFRFDPCDDFTIVKIKEIHFYHYQRLVETAYEFSTNAFHNKESLFLFDKNDPFICLNLQNPIKIDQVSIELEYLKIGEEEFTEIKKLQKEIIKDKSKELEICSKKTELIQHLVNENKIAIKDLRKKVSEAEKTKNEIQNKFIHNQEQLQKIQSSIFFSVYKKWELLIDAIPFLHALRDKIKYWKSIKMISLINNSPFFNEKYYLDSNTDIRTSGISAAHHYLIYGGNEGRNPSKDFDSQFYLDNNLDVKNENINPLIHYLLFGQKENRLPKPIIPHFSPPKNDFAISVPFQYDIEPLNNSLSIAVICHVFYLDLVDEIKSYLLNIPTHFDLFISTDTNEKINYLQKSFSKWGKGSVSVRLVENRGRDIAPKLLTWHNVYDKYEYFLHIHTKKTPQVPQLSSWRRYLFENLLGSEDIVKSIFEAFESDQKLGIIASQHFSKVRQIIGWGFNYQIAEEVAKKLGIELSIDGPIDFPSGSMFWARSAAIKPLLSDVIKISDFPEETGQNDQTISHAIERLFFFICEKSGYKWNKIISKSESSETLRHIIVTNRDQLKRIIDETQRPLLTLNNESSIFCLSNQKNNIENQNHKINLDNTAELGYYQKIHANSPYSFLGQQEFFEQLQLHHEGKKSMIDFDEAFYLEANKDVAKFVKMNLIESGFVHFCLNGQYENRLWSNHNLRDKFNLEPNYPSGMFAPTNIKTKLTSKPIQSGLAKSKEPFLLILLGHLQSDLFYAGYGEFFKDFVDVFDQFSKIMVSVESNTFESNLATRYSKKMEVNNQSELLNLTSLPDVVICFSNHMVTKALKLFNDSSKLVYYCQEYEAGFFPYGYEFIEAERAIKIPKNIIISTLLLKNFLQKKKLLLNQRTYVTSPEIERLAVNTEKTKKLFFYFRPEYFHTRNIPEILWDSVSDFTQKHKGYEIYMIGSIDTRFSFEIHGSPVFVINKLPKDEYVDLITSCDVVIAMIYSAHPGVIAFQAAASGIPTVTNVFENRDANTLTMISENIVPYDPLKDQLLEKIEEALTMPKGIISFNEELYSGKKESLSLSQYIANIKDKEHD